MIILHCAHNNKKIHIINNMQSSVSWKKQCGYNSWESLSARRRTNWWPLNNCCWLQTRVQASTKSRKSQSNYSVFSLAGLRFDEVCLSHFFSLTPPSSFLPTSPLCQRKLEMHIVTVGCFHLHSHFWHGQAWAPSALGEAWMWTKWWQNDKPGKKKLTLHSKDSILLVWANLILYF